MKLISYISIGVIVLIACFLLFRGCKQGKALQSIQDSLNVEKALNDTIKIKTVKMAKITDSIAVKNTNDSVKYVFKIDSLTRVVQTLKGQFKVTKDSIGTLYGQLKIFYLNHDSVALLATYNRLYTELTEANNQIFAIQIGHDSIDNANGAEIVRLNGVVNKLQGQIGDLQGLLIACTSNASNLAATGSKAIKKARMNALFSKIGAVLAAIVTILLITK